MTRRFWIAGLVGGVAMFLWASFAHMTPLLATAGIQRMANEPLVLAQLQASLGTRHGLYMYPNVAPGQAGPQAAGPAATMPSGLILYRPPGAMRVQPRQLAGEFLLELLETLVATWLLSMSAIPRLGARIGFFAGLGVLAAVVTNGSYWLWYGFPAAFSLAAMLTEFGKFLVAGVTVALVLGRTPARVYATAAYYGVPGQPVASGRPEDALRVDVSEHAPN